MKKEKELFLVFVILILIGLGIFWYLNGISVVSDPTASQEFSAEVQNSPPIITIYSVDNVGEISPDNIVDLIPATSTPVEIIFDIDDDGGAGGLDPLTLNIDYSSSGEITRSLSILKVQDDCANVVSGLTITYTCFINMQFYDGAGSWNADVSIMDSTSEVGSGTFVFSVNQLKHISASPPLISFGIISSGNTNILSTVDTVISNNGNFNVPADGPLKISSADLVGEIDNTESIPATNFRSAASSDFLEVCSGPGGMDLTGDLLNPMVIPNVILPKGVLSTEIFRHCLKTVPVLSSQIYSTSSGGTPWTFTIA